MAYRHRATQLSFQSFNNGLGVPLSSDNEWVQLADMLPWQQLDEAYQHNRPAVQPLNFGLF